jgi:hypothetical protein
MRMSRGASIAREGERRKRGEKKKKMESSMTLKQFPPNKSEDREETEWRTRGEKKASEYKYHKR